MSGYLSDQVIGTSCADGILMHVDDKGNCLCANGCPLAAVIQDGMPHDPHVFMHHADGYRVPVYVRGAAIHDRHGSVIGAGKIFSDDTDRIGVMERLKDLEREALLDELTGLANRRYFNRALDACLANNRRNNTPFGLSIIDIDHFKQFNDTYGHDIGDAVLRMVAQTLSRNCRPYDTPARWGGEEFALISEQVDEESLYSIADRMRILIAKSSFSDGGMSLSTTVSIGGCVIRPEDDANSLVKRTDACLYERKRNGRNRTTIKTS